MAGSLQEEEAQRSSLPDRSVNVIDVIVNVNMIDLIVNVNVMDLIVNVDMMGVIVNVNMMDCQNPTNLLFLPGERLG